MSQRKKNQQRKKLKNKTELFVFLGMGDRYEQESTPKEINTKTKSKVDKRKTS